MFRFANTYILYFLLLIPVFVLLYLLFLRYRRNRLERYASGTLLPLLMPEVSKAKLHLRFVLWTLAMMFIIFGLARPQFGSKLEEMKREGIEIIIALDVSNSMMAEDIKPNRLERAKMAISRLVDNLDHDRVGLIVFAGDAFIQLPVTTDYVSAKMFLSSINTDMVPVQGTAIGSAIRLGMRSFSPQTEASKVIVVITDGENHEDDALEAAEQAQEKGITVYTIGMGLQQGAPIPVQPGSNNYIRDKAGQIVVSKLNDELLNSVAVAGGGRYIPANNTQVGLNALLGELREMEQGEFEARVYTDYNDQFQYPVLAAFILLLIDLLIVERKSKWLQKLKIS